MAVEVNSNSELGFQFQPTTVHEICSNMNEKLFEKGYDVAEGTLNNDITLI